jgi:hypothetical protein
MSKSFRDDWRIGTALIVALLGLGVIGGVIVYFMSPAPAQQVPMPQASPLDMYADIPFDPMLLEIDKAALTQAYHDQVKHLFDVWMRGQAQNTREATAGFKIARRAYSLAAAQIAKREAQPGSKQP